MSSYGFLATNNSGTTIIDQNYHNLALIASGTHTCSSPSATAGSYDGISFTNTSSELPLVFIVPQTSGYICIGTINTSSFSVYAQQGVASFDYYVFGRPPSTTQHIGLQVFDSSGNKTFDSNYNYLNIKQIIPLNANVNYNESANTTSTTTHTLSPSTNIAVATSDPGYVARILTGGSISGGFTYDVVGRVGFKKSGSSLVVGAFQTVSNTTPPGSSSVNTRVGHEPFQAITADITYL